MTINATNTNYNSNLGISKHTKNSEIINMMGEIYADYQALLERNDLSLEGFKQEYLKIKERYDDFAEKYKNMPEEDRISKFAFLLLACIKAKCAKILNKVLWSLNANDLSSGWLFLGSARVF